MRNTPSAIVHFYRATVMHADLWRKRLDITTNWSVVTTAGIITFAFSEPTHPHLSILVAYPFTLLFIMMESRRYQMYDMWRHRVRLLNRFVVAPSLAETASNQKRIDRELLRLAEQLGTSVPRLRLRDAVGYRIRRNYGLLFGAIFIMWLMKLFAHPTPAQTFMEVLSRGHIGSIPGWLTFVLVLGFCAYAFYLGARAPTERMVDWVQMPSPLDQFLDPEGKGRELTLCIDELDEHGKLIVDEEEKIVEKPDEEESS